MGGDNCCFRRAFKGGLRGYGMRQGSVGFEGLGALEKLRAGVEAVGSVEKMCSKQTVAELSYVN